MSRDDEQTVFRVLINRQEQYSIWSLWRPVPDGWRDTGFSGRRRQCLAHIDGVWTDMRPLSLRRLFAEL